jgi:2-oxoglutarate dehydrogenase E2 component (dihydrolipoamide succinyltransferase)
VATDVELPQLGESVTEGTVTSWLVNVGETVEADQPLFELSSDKIDTEVPSPAGGVLKEIKVGVDETVDVGTVVAVIGDAGEEPEPGSGEQAAAPSDGESGQSAAGEAAESTAPAEPAQAEEPQPAGDGNEQPAPAAADSSGGGQPAGDGQSAAAGDGEGALMSPLVRRMADEHDVDVSRITGSGRGGRITREDVEAAVSGQDESAQGPAQAPQPAQAPAQQPPQPAGSASPAGSQSAPREAGERERVEDLSRVRQRIAAKMMESMQSAAQLTTVQEADVSHIMALRARYKDEFKRREGVSLSPFVFMARAAVLALRRHETLNAHPDWEAGRITFREYVNLGIAVDTEKGLMVPNVKGADELTLAGLARGINEAADKARGAKKLDMSDIEGGTFTVTNTGSRGVLIDTPILNYPEPGILGTGAIQKRPVVVDDDQSGSAIAVRDMAYLCLTYDHRLIDGADAARYVTEVKQIVEAHDWDDELGY